MQVFIAEDNCYEREKLRKYVLSWAQLRSLDLSVVAVRSVADIDTHDLRLCNCLLYTSIYSTLVVILLP